MWHSVLVDEFPDAMPIAPGSGLHYILDVPVLEVIGISCLVRFSHPGGAVRSSLRILRLGDAFDLSLEPLTAARTRVRVRIRGATHDIGQLQNPCTRFAELRLDWHTSGRTYLRVDGRLVGYHDAFGRGSQLTIADVAFGSAASVPGSPDPCYRLDRFSVSTPRRRTHGPRLHVAPARPA
jgi:hypothetical protein